MTNKTSVVSYDPEVAWRKLDGELGRRSSSNSHVTFRLSPEMMELGFLGKIGPENGVFIYERLGHPDTWAFERYCAALEGTESACAVGSGQAAITTMVDACCRSGDHIVASNRLYGGTVGKLKKLLDQRGIGVTFVDITNHREVFEAICVERTRLLLAETVSNPSQVVAEIPRLASIAHKQNVLVGIDNTFTPLIVLPALHGADIVWHSLTKYIGGESDMMGGVLCANKDLTNKFIAERSLNGTVLHHKNAVVFRKRIRSLGAHMKRHSALALAVAKYMEGRGFKVLYPGLPGNPMHEVMRPLMRTTRFGYGGVVTLDLREAQMAKALATEMDRSGFAVSAVSLGSATTYVCAPLASVLCALRDGADLPPDLSPGLVRVALGHTMSKADALRRLGAALERYLKQ